MTDQIELGDASTDGPPDDVLGVPEAIDADNDGTIEAWLMQVDAESFVVLSDTDRDYGADTMAVDINGDGLPELLVSETADGYRMQSDFDGDGTFESDSVVTRDELEATYPGAFELLSTSFGDSASPEPTPSDQQPDQIDQIDQLDPSQPTVPINPVDPIDPADQNDPGSPVLPGDLLEPSIDDGLVQDGMLIGDPQGAAELWFEQAANGFCVPASISQIVGEYTGVHFADEQHLVDRANELHLFEVGPDGVPSISIDGAEALLEDAGVPAEVLTDLSITSLIEFVDDDRAVMLAVDSGELWTGELAEDETADHAVVLTGFDLDRGVAILSDPGQPDGNQFEVKISDLEDAWADSGHAALVCDTPPGDMPTSDLEPGNVSAVEPSNAAGAAPEVSEASVAAAPESESQLGRVVSWVMEHPYALLPVVLAAPLLIARKK